MKSGVYFILNEINGKYYIGSSVDIEARFERHLHELGNGTHHNIKLLNDYNKYGAKCFKIFILEECSSDLKIHEQSWIDMTNSRLNGYNMNGANGGDAISNHPNNIEIRNKISNSLNDFYSSLTEEERKEKYGKIGKDNHMYGKTHSLESKQKIKDKIQDWYKTNESPLKGVPKSEEHRNKISDFAKTRTGEKNPFYGKKHSEETKKKLSEIQKSKDKSKHVSNKPVLADGVEYFSVSECARSLDISPALVLYRIKSKKYDYKYKNA